jgi:23S rRNA U2552 (ribose-2'-O)-methylase RlmE/FtsJ
MYELAWDHGLFPIKKHHDTEAFVTAHLCEGPGGFIECFSRWCDRRSIPHAWVGITLRETETELNFREEIHAATTTTSVSGGVVFYGADGTGDLLRAENRSAFSKFVRSSHNQEGADVVTADGGIYIPPAKLCDQEAITLKLIYAECLCGCTCLRPHGHFVLKLFDVQLPETKLLLYDISTIFRRVYLCKPLTSRVCNSERYMVAKDLQCHTKEERDRFKSVIARWETFLSADSPDSQWPVPTNEWMAFNIGLENYIEEFARIQFDFLKQAHDLAIHPNRQHDREIRTEQMHRARAWCMKYGL